MPSDTTPYEGQLHSDDITTGSQVLPVDIRKKHNAGQDGPVVFYGETLDGTRTEDWTGSQPVNVITRRVTADWAAADQRVKQDVLKRQKAAAGLLI